MGIGDKKIRLRLDGKGVIRLKNGGEWIIFSPQIHNPQYENLSDRYLSLTDHWKSLCKEKGAPV